MNFRQMEKDVIDFRGSEWSGSNSRRRLGWVPCGNVNALFNLARVINCGYTIYPCHAFSPHFVLKIFDELIDCGLTQERRQHERRQIID